ncbi:hypothetical protein D3C81_1625620 [compost metagenome]
MVVACDHAADAFGADLHAGRAEVVETHAIERLVAVAEDDAVVQPGVGGIGVLAVLIREPGHAAPAFRATRRDVSYLAVLTPGGGQHGVVPGVEVAITATAPQGQLLDRLVLELAVEAELLPGGIAQGAVGIDVMLGDKHTFLRLQVFELESAAQVELEVAMGRLEPGDVVQVATNTAVVLAGPAAVRTKQLRSRRRPG